MLSCEYARIRTSNRRALSRKYADEELEKTRTAKRPSPIQPARFRIAGLPEGKYRILVAPPDNPDPDRPRPLPFDKRFTSFDKSGLEYTVKPGKNEFFTVTVEKPKGR